MRTQGSSSTRRRIRGRATLAGMAAAWWLTGAGPAAAGSAPPDDGLTVVPENGSPGRLSLTSDPSPPLFPELSPGDEVWWQVGAHLRDADQGELALRIETSGELVAMPGGLLASARSCSQPWTTAGTDDDPPTCPSSVTVFDTMRLADVTTGPIPLGPITPAQSAWVLFTLTLPDDAGNEMQDRAGRFAAAFTASGDTPAQPAATTTTTPGASPTSEAGTTTTSVARPTTPDVPPRPLPHTGTDVAGSIGAAVGAVGGGLLLAFLARRRANARTSGGRS